MELAMKKATLLGKNIKGFVQYIQKSYQENNKNLSHPDQLFRLKLLVEEFKFHIIADELIRINRFVYDEKYTVILVENFQKGMQIISEYIENNYDDLFIFSARLYTLKQLGSSYSDLNTKE